MAQPKRGCLILLTIAALAVVVALIVAWWWLPGEVRWGPSPIAKSPPRVTEREVPPASVALAEGQNPAQPVALPVRERRPTPPTDGVWATYVVPEDLMRQELAKAFPIQQNVADLVKVRLDNPEFLAEQDGDFLRVRLQIEARVVEGEDRLQGSVEVRTRLGYDREGRKVMLVDAEVVGLSLQEGQGGGTSLLQTVLGSELAADMEGYPILTLPTDGPAWMRLGGGWVKNVYVKDGRVHVAVGP